MERYQVKNKKQCWYGESIGILILNAHYPCIPGNVGNATTFRFPVRYKVVKEASIKGLLKLRDPALAEPFVRAALELQDDGVKAVTGACGFMALFQNEVRNALEIPVFLSSLIQVPFIHRILGGIKKIGIITADSQALGPDHFLSIGVPYDDSLRIAGMEDQKEFREAVLEEKGTLDSGLIRSEVLAVARRLAADPAVGAILLECSDLPPYASAIQEELRLPVFDFVTMIGFVHSALVRVPFSGFL